MTKMRTKTTGGARAKAGTSLGALALASLMATTGAQAQTQTQTAPTTPPVRQTTPQSPVAGSDPAVDTSGNPTLTPAADGPSRANDTGADTTQTAATAGEGSEADSAQDIVVTGFRASIQSSLNDKRYSDVQIDAINAQDIADFPDANLAESLQRLPGVSVDRDNGEGRGITVRGLGGDFNRTRLNGIEALSTAGSNDSGTSPNRSRSFDYSTFASELFSSLKVQKTPSAETDEGSLGATIDLETGRPFDFKGTRIGDRELQRKQQEDEPAARWPRLVPLRRGQTHGVPVLGRLQQDRQHHRPV